GEADIAQDATRLQSVGFDYDYAWRFQSSMANFGSGGTSANTLKNAVNTLVSASSGKSFGRMLYVTNHDQNYNDGGRTLSTMYGDNRYALTVLAYTAFGMPLIYNGQETGGNQILDYFNDTKINWNSSDAKMRNTIRTLTALKHSQDALIHYKSPSQNPAINWVSVSGSNSVLAFTRTKGSSQILVVINLGTSSATATLSGLAAGEWSLWLNSQTVASGVSRTDQSLSSSQSFTLEAKGYRVYVKGESGGDIEPEQPLGDLTDSSYCSVFYECPEEATICVWLWNADKGQFTANSWPGDQLSRLGVTAEGKVVYKYEVNISAADAMPTNLIFTKNGSADANKTFTGAFVNHGYYIEGQGVATTTVPSSSSEPIVTEHDIYLVGEISSWAPSDSYKFAYDSSRDVYTLSGISLTALKDWENGIPNFKLIDNGTWYGYNGEITAANSTVTLLAGDNVSNATIAAGTYSFIYSAATHQLTVTGFSGEPVGYDFEVRFGTLAQDNTTWENVRTLPLTVKGENESLFSIYGLDLTMPAVLQFHDKALDRWYPGNGDYWYGLNAEHHTDVTLTPADNFLYSLDGLADGLYAVELNTSTMTFSLLFPGEFTLLMGDVNNDGNVDVSDVVALANYTMGDSVEGFNAAVADLNGVDGIDVADVVALAGIVMGD
ncbi:MAG: hypothetical protein IJ626_02615, partial [Muribaculaceae bacterium]|nr:hypothetical protein [Muribaculaceae bacterium]